MPDPSTSTVEVSDFSPGIYGDYHGGVASTSQGSIPKNGAATIASTYRCCADASGALVPLPARVVGKTQALVCLENTTPSFYPANNRAMYLTDAVVAAPFREPIAVTTNASDSESVFCLWQQFHDPGGASTYRHLWIGRQYQVWRGVQTVDFFWGKQLPVPAAYPAPLGSGNLTWARQAEDTTAQEVVASMKLCWHFTPSIPAFWEFGGTLPATGAIPANELTLTTFEADNAVGANYLQTAATTPMAYAWPSLTSLGVNYDHERITGGVWGGGAIMLGHQGRLVLARIGASAFGGVAGNAIYHNNDYLVYLPADDLSNSGTQCKDLLVGEENITGVGTVASLSADELLIIRNSGGGYLIRGDLDNPTVSRLPYIESTYGVTANPIATPIGLVYGSKNGIFTWAGGDTAEKLSKQIDGFFWRHEEDATNEKYAGYRGRFGYWHPWVCVPNNFLFDTRSGGWWKLEDPTSTSTLPYNCYDVVPTSGKLLAFPYKITPANTAAWDAYDPAVLASSYSWKSQPLLETRDRVASFQEVTLVASPGSNTAACTVIVTLSGFDKDGAVVTPVATTFTFTGTGTGSPVIKRKDVVSNFSAMYVQMTIAASATSGAAPKIHSVKLGLADRQRAAKS